MHRADDACVQSRRSPLTYRPTSSAIFSVAMPYQLIAMYREMMMHPTASDHQSCAEGGNKTR